jgi:hypothetical protein
MEWKKRRLIQLSSPVPAGKWSFEVRNPLNRNSTYDKGRKKGCNQAQEIPLLSSADLQKAGLIFD